MKRKIISSLLLIIIIFGMLLTVPVHAARDFFVVSLKTDKTVIAKGDTLKLTLSVTNMSSEGGIKTLKTTFDFDGVFELATGNTETDVEGKNNWSITFNANEGILLAENTRYITEPGEICTINLKLKETADIASYRIKVTNSSAGAKNVTTNLAEKITATDVETTVSVKSIGAKVNSVIIDGTKIKGINPNTTASQMSNYISGTYKIKFSLNKLNEERGGLVDAYVADIEIPSDDVVESGMRLVVNETEEYTIYVKGDLNGDGEANFIDVVAMRMAMVGLRTPPYVDAGDIDLDGENNSPADFARLIDFDAGIITSL